MNNTIASLRLANQGIAPPVHESAVDLVRRLGAVQAQEYAAAKWALALRLASQPADADLDREVDEGRILRTHVMRPTWHFVAPADIHWMLALTAPRVRRALTYGYRMFGLDDAVCKRATKIFERALRDGAALTRPELGVHLARSGLAMKGVMLALVTIHAEIECAICSGPRRGRQLTYALLDHRAPSATRFTPEEALAELTSRFFRSHGPATIRDFVWWSGLTMTEAKRGVDAASARRETIDGKDYWTIGATAASRPRRGRVDLLPIYDEYLVAYRDLDAVPRGPGQFGRLEQAIVVDGQVAGTWQSVRSTKAAVMECTLRRRLTDGERRALAKTAARYGRFLGVPLSINVRNAPRAGRR
jgi:hypothetical protein